MATTTNITPVAGNERDPFAAPEAELEALQGIAQALSQTEFNQAKLVTESGEETVLSPTLLRLLRLAANTLAADRAVVLESFGRLVTPYQAAELIGVPASYVDKLLSDGELSHVNGSAIRLLSRDDVLDFHRAYKAQQREALDELARLSQELGLYDLDFDASRLKCLAEFAEDDDEADEGQN